jgi:hypothetical protein
MGWRLRARFYLFSLFFSRCSSLKLFSFLLVLLGLLLQRSLRCPVNTHLPSHLSIHFELGVDGICGIIVYRERATLILSLFSPTQAYVHTATHKHTHTHARSTKCGLFRLAALSPPQRHQFLIFTSFFFSHVACFFFLSLVLTQEKEKRQMRGSSRKCTEANVTNSVL